MKKMFLLVLAMFDLSGCGQSPSQPMSTASGTPSSWAYKMINWHEHIYKLTSERVPVVRKHIGSVTNYSTVESTSQTGTFSNFFPVGTKLFEIPSVPTSSAFAVQTKDGYVKVVDTGTYEPKGSSSN